MLAEPRAEGLLPMPGVSHQDWQEVGGQCQQVAVVVFEPSHLIAIHREMFPCSQVPVCLCLRRMGCKFWKSMRSARMTWECTHAWW